MAPVNTASILTAADFDAIQNRVAVALAKRERLIKSWTASSARPRPPPKSQEELDAEDAELFNPTPAGLGLGAPIPKEFLDGDVKRKEIWNNDKLRSLIMGKRVGLQASKPRDGKEKAGSVKRGLEEESSDEDEGRSALGKAKKSKNGTSPGITMKPPKDGIREEVKQEVKPTSKLNGIPEPNHAGRSDAEPQSKAYVRTEVSPTMPSLQKLNVQATVRKMPLVDYPSDDEGDGNEIVSTAIPTSNVASSLSSSCTTVVGEVNHNLWTNSKDEPSIIQNSASPPIVSANSDKKKLTQSTDHVSNNGIDLITKLSSKSSSSHSSISRASSTESEPSDMETAIPLALTPDVVERTSLHTTSAEEARRDKKRQKRARRKEREQQRKALAPSIASGGAEKSAIASTVGTGVAKKIKDRLLDANGN